MIQANIAIVPIEDIIIPEGRQREGLGGGREAQLKLAELAESIKKHGVLNPIILTEGRTLVAGFRRLTAAKAAGQLQVPCRFTEDLTELEREEIELDENIHRVDLSWQERTDAIARLHKMKQAQDPKWGRDNTAAIAGVEPERVSRSLQLSEMRKMFPQLSKAKNMSQAISQMMALAKGVNRVQAVKNNPIDYEQLESKIVLGDSVDIIKGIPDESFHHIITDPPFGINFDNRISDGTDAITQYEDGASSYRRLLGMAPDLFRVLKPDGFLVWFLGISWYEEAKLVFQNAGFTVDEIPLIWDRSSGHTFSRRPDRYFTRGYDIALHCIKGNAELTKRGRPNIFKIDPVPSADQEQSVERPIELYAELIRYLSVRGEIIADFFSGSGSCAAAAALNGRDFWGCELDPIRRSRALSKIKANLPDNAKLE